MRGLWVEEIQGIREVSVESRRAASGGSRPLCPLGQHGQGTTRISSKPFCESTNLKRLSELLPRLAEIA
jgi:hypothetical protein